MASFSASSTSTSTSTSSTMSTSFSYPMILFNDHILINKEGETIVIDSGGMFSLYNRPSININGRIFPINSTFAHFMKLSTSKLTKLLGYEGTIDGLLGIDILKIYNIEFDFENLLVTFSLDELKLAGESAAGEKSGDILPIIINNTFALIPFYYENSSNDTASISATDIRFMDFKDIKIKDMTQLIDQFKLNRTGLCERSELLQLLEDAKAVAISNASASGESQRFRKGTALLDTGAPNAVWIKDRSHEKYPVDSSITEFKLGYNNDEHFETTLYKRPCKLFEDSSEFDVKFWSFPAGKSMSDTPTCPECNIPLRLETANPYIVSGIANPGDEMHCNLCYSQSKYIYY